MMDIISVIVPVYNVEKYIDKCIQSIVNQTYKNLEIILVDDGSPDNCPKICDEWQKKDSRIKVIHKQNGGVSSARNEGLDAAKGRYISFVDGDDYIQPQMMEALYSAFKNNRCQLAVCGYYRNSAKIVNSSVAVMKQHEAECALFNISQFPCFEGFVWNKLYSSDIIKNNSLRFDTTYNMCEDTLFNFSYLRFINCAAVVDKAYYNYVIREDSVMSVKPLKNDFDMIDLIDRFLSDSETKEQKEMIAVWAFKYWIKVIDNCNCFGCEREDYKNRARRSIKKYNAVIISSPFTSAVEKTFAVLINYFYPVYYLYKNLKYLRKRQSY